MQIKYIAVICLHVLLSGVFLYLGITQPMFFQDGGLPNFIIVLMGPPSSLIWLGKGVASYLLGSAIVFGCLLWAPRQKITNIKVMIYLFSFSAWIVFGFLTFGMKV